MITEIISNLWISNFKDLKKSDKFLKDKNIQLIINCTNELPFLKIMNNIKKIRYKINDTSIINNNYIFKLNKLIHKYRDNDVGVLIYCHSGTQCSPMLVCCYLIQYSKISNVNIISSVQNKYEYAFNEHNNFSSQLDKYHFFINNK